MLQYTYMAIDFIDVSSHNKTNTSAKTYLLRELFFFGKYIFFDKFSMGFWLRLIRMQNNYELQKKNHFSFQSCADSH